MESGNFFFNLVFFLFHSFSGLSDCACDRRRQVNLFWKNLRTSVLCFIQGCSCTMHAVVMITELLGIVFTFLNFALVVYILLFVSFSIIRCCDLLLFHDNYYSVYRSIDFYDIGPCLGSRKKYPIFLLSQALQVISGGSNGIPRPDGIYNPFSTFWVYSRGFSQVDMPRILQQGSIQKAFHSNALTGSTFRVKKCHIQSWSFFWMSEHLD